MNQEQNLLYEIRIGNSLDSSWSSWFDGMEIIRESQTVTVLTGPVVDQAALYGLLGKIRDLGLVLLSVNWV
jgi:hypothetical protein